MKRTVLVASLAIAGASLVFAQNNTQTTPSKTPTTTTTTSATCKVAAVNVNTATKEQLMTIPGINDKLATQITSKRPFKNEADLVKRVKGIGKHNIVGFRPCFLYQ
ncbi:MAG: DNA-binding protein [Meiothermus sp.]